MGVGLGGRVEGGQAGCDRSIEVLVKISKKKTIGGWGVPGVGRGGGGGGGRLGGGGGRLGGQGGCERRIEVFVIIQKKKIGGGGGGSRWM